IDEFHAVAWFATRRRSRRTLPLGPSRVIRILHRFARNTRDERLAISGWDSLWLLGLASACTSECLMQERDCFEASALSSMSESVEVVRVGQRRIRPGVKQEPNDASPPFGGGKNQRRRSRG